MAGLLDFAMYDDPASVGRLAFGAGLLNAAGPSKMPISFGQALAGGLMGAQNASTEAAMNQRRNRLVDIQMQRHLAEIAEAQQTRLAQAKAQAEREAFLSGLPARLNMPMQGGPTLANAAAQGQVSPDMLADAFRLGIKPDDLRALAGQTEVARTVDTEGPTGKTVQQLDKYGRPVGAGLPGYVAPVQVNQGNQVTFAKPTAGLSLPIGMSPSERDTSARGWATVDLARQRLAVDRAGGEKPAPKPLPTQALKMVNEARDAIGVTASVNADMAALESAIDSGDLSFGPISNVLNTGRNMAGMSTQESRNFGTFKSSLERLRNESLRLNTGVQTEGDAQRAWNELFSSINDTKLVKQRLQEIQRLNQRAAQLQQLKADAVLTNYGHDPLDVTQYQQTPAAVGGGGSTWGQSGAPASNGGWSYVGPGK